MVLCRFYIDTIGRNNIIVKMKIKILVAIGIVSILINCSYSGLCLEKEGEVVGQVSTKESDWYAIIKDMKTGSSKLYTSGDIIYSEMDITKCLRILEIKEGAMLLNDLETAEIYILTPGEKILLEGSDKVFERTVEASILEYQYLKSEELAKKGTEDFTVKAFSNKKIVLEKGHTKRQDINLTEEERSLFDAPMREKTEEKLKGENFMGIIFNKVSENEWEVDRTSASSAIKNAEKVLFSIILNTQPRFRLREGPSLNFTTEMGDAALNREGFIIRNLAIAELGKRSGIKEGDIIKRVNGQSVNSLLGIYRAYMSIKQNPEARLVRLEIIREGKPIILTYRIK